MITRHEKEIEIINGFENDSFKAYSLVPGFSLYQQDMLANRPIEMNSCQINEAIKQLYGNSLKKIQGKYSKADVYVFNFKNETILALSEGNSVGTSWYWITNDNGSRYGNPMLLSFDSEVKHFWSEFCKQITLETKDIIHSKIKKIKP